MNAGDERSHRGIGFDYEAALEDPARKFTTPTEIRLYPWLTFAEKAKLLRAWAHNLEQQAGDGSVKLEQPSGLYNQVRQELRALPGHH